MNPAWSVIFFTTLAGAAQGLVLTLAVSLWLGVAPGRGLFVQHALLVAGVLLLLGLGASFLHLGHPKRAWRAVLMWRTSWLSREVIVLPAFIAVVGLWWALMCAHRGAAALPALAALAVALAGLLWWCTAMIYACLRFVQEWAHRLTLINFVLIGCSSGLILAGALAAFAGYTGYARFLELPALAVTLLAWATRTAALRRNDGLRPKSTAQSATGIASPRLRQMSMGMTGGSFNTREFFHGVGRLAMGRIRLAVHVLCFGLPAALVLAAKLSGHPKLMILAYMVQTVGLLAERWLFFAQARHPQNLYYQVVS